MVIWFQVHPEMCACLYMLLRICSSLTLWWIPASISDLLNTFPVCYYCTEFSINDSSSWLMGYWDLSYSCWFSVYYFFLLLNESASEAAQLCLTLCDPVDCSLPVSSVHGLPGKNTGMGCHFLLQGIFPTQGLNLGLLHCWQMLYHLSHQYYLSFKL